MPRSSNVPRARWSHLVAPSLLLALACGVEPEPRRARPPNVVLVVVDDLGWADVGYHGGATPTPSIDRLAREGVALESFYVSPICSATRAALLTGRYPIRYGLGRDVIPPWRDYGLDPDEVTLAEDLARAGFEQRAAFGKWHLGHLDQRWHPLERGFTSFRGHYNGAVDHFTQERGGERDWHVDLEPHEEQGYSTDLIADAASRFLREHAGQGPFLCYVAFNAPHAPFQAPGEYLERVRSATGEPGRPTVEETRAAMIACLDDGIGRILAALDDSGAAEDTLVWFLSDNGAGPEAPGANLPLRGGKATLYEGGIRVPASVRWPRGLPGGRRCEVPLAAVDVLPTLLQVCGVAAPAGRELDGLGMVEVLRGRAEGPPRELYFYFGQEGPQREVLAARTPRWKLLVHGPDLTRTPLGPAHRTLLFDIVDDPHESVDLAAAHPDVVARLAASLAAFRGLQTDEPVPYYWEGHEGFVAPADWSLEARR